MRTRKLLALATAGIFYLAFGSVSAIGQTYDAAADFSATNNPNGVWKYGWSARRGSAFNLYTNHFTLFDLDFWDNASSIIAPGTPGLSHNGTGSEVTFLTVTVPAGKLTMHPGINAENSVLRWTAPASGTYQITGTFAGRDFVYPTTTDVAVLHGSIGLFSGNINSYNVPLPFSSTASILAGETVDFTVGYGSNGNYIGDSTSLDATIRLAAPNECVPPPDGMVGWWPLDETSGPLAADVIGANNGEYRDTPMPVPGEVAGALHFDGENDAVRIGSVFPFHRAGGATLDFWLKTPATRHQSVFWTRADNQDTNRFNIFVNEDSTFGFDYRDPNGELHILLGECCTGVPISRDTWTHLAITKTRETSGADTYTLYVNGTVAGTAQDSNPNLPTATGWQMSGRDGFIYNGILDEVEVFNRALSAEEIAAIFNAGSAGKCRQACAADVTSQLRIARGPILFEDSTQLFVQRVKLTNISSSVISGPAYLVLDNLGSRRTRLANQNGVTECAAPLGSPYRRVNLGLDDALSPGEYGVVILRFRHPVPGAITYNPRVLAGDGPR